MSIDLRKTFFRCVVSFGKGLSNSFASREMYASLSAAEKSLPYYNHHNATLSIREYSPSGERIATYYY